MMTNRSETKTESKENDHLISRCRYSNPIGLCKAYGGPISIIRVLCQFRNVYEEEREDDHKNEYEHQYDHEQQCCSDDNHPKIREQEQAQILESNRNLSINHFKRNSNRTDISSNSISNNVKRVMAATLAIACKYDTGIQNEILLSKPNVIKDMMECILILSNHKQRLSSSMTFIHRSLTDFDFAACSFVECMICLLNRYCVGNDRRRMKESKNSTCYSEMKENIDDIDNGHQDNGQQQDDDFGRFVISSCIEEGCIIHGFILLLYDVVLRVSDNGYSNTSKLIVILIRAIRLFFISLKQRCSVSTLTQVFRKIPLNKLISTITTMISKCARFKEGNKDIIMHIYALFGDILVLARNNKILAFEEIIFRSFLSEKVLPTLLDAQRSEKDTNRENSSDLTKIVVFSIETILQSRSMGASARMDQRKIRIVLESIVRSTNTDGKLFVNSHNGMFNTHILRQWTGILACYWKLCRQKISVLSASTNLRGKQRMSSRRKKHRPILKHQVINMMFQNHLIIPLMWVLVHSKKSIMSNAEIIFDSMSRDVGFLFENQQLVYLLKRGCVQVLYGVQEKCRIQGRDSIVDSVSRFLAGMRAKLLSSTKILKEKKDGHDSYVGLFHQFCEEIEVSSSSKPFIFKELFLLYADMIRISPVKANSYCVLEGFTHMSFSWDTSENIFLCMRQAAEILPYLVATNKVISSHLDTHGASLFPTNISQKLVMAKVYCKDKDVTLMMECTSMQRLILNAPLLAKKLIKREGVDEDGGSPLLLDLSVSSFRAFEEYLCHIDVGIKHQKDYMLQNYDVTFCILLIHLAKDFGSHHLVLEYLQVCHVLIDSSNCIDVLELAFEVSSVPSILRTLKYLVKNHQIFVQSLYFVSKQKTLQNCTSGILIALERRKRNGNLGQTPNLFKKT